MKETLTQKEVDRVLRRLKPQLPQWVAEVHATPGVDPWGYPYVRVLFLVEDDDFESILPATVTRSTQRRVVEAFQRETTSSVHFRYRTLREQAEFDEEDRREAEKARRRRRA